MKIWRKFKSWFLCKYCGYVRLSKYVDVKVTLSKPSITQGKFNPELIVGKKVDTGWQSIAEDDGKFID